MEYIIILLFGVLIAGLVYIYSQDILAKAAKKVQDSEKLINQSQNLIYEAKVKAEREYNKILLSLKDDYNRISAELEKEFNSKKQKNLEDLARQVQEITEKLILYKNTQEKAIEKEIKDFGERRVNDFLAKVDHDLFNIRKDYQEQINVIKSNADLTSQEIAAKIAELKSLEKAAIDARIREYEEKHKEDFYKIMVSESDMDEIDELEKIVDKFKNPIPIRKAIFEVYYKKPITDLIGRITQGRRITGIYKITNTITGQCYIGQSVDIGSRWMQHCKRGAGVDEKTNLKLYAAMAEEGLYNFKFEIVEEVEEQNLSKQEKYWSEYFGAKVFGYSIKN